MQPENTLSLEQLYKTYYTPIYRRVFRIVHNAADAEDVTQETFLRALSALATFDPSRGSMVGWLFTIAVHTAINYTRLSHVRAKACSLDELPCEPADPHTRLAEETKQVMEALQHLKPRYRDVLYLRGAGYSIQELATHFGKSTRTMRTWLTEARVALRKQQEACA